MASGEPRAAREAEDEPESRGEDGAPRRVAVVAAHEEADRIGQTIAALREALPGIHVVVADDASGDGTAQVALMAGAEVVSRGRPHGKGHNVSAACTAALEGTTPETTFLLADGDLASSAARLVPLVEAVERGRCDLAVAAFERRIGGGLGAAKGFSRWAIRRLSGFEAREPISGQRAMSASTLERLLPFAPRYGMETAMTIDAVRAGLGVAEIELDLEHRATGRDLRGFLHRGRQLKDFALVYVSYLVGRR